MMKSSVAYKSDQIEERIYKLAHHIDHISLNGSAENFSSFVESAKLKQSDYMFLDENLILHDVYGCLDKLRYMDAVERTIILMDIPQRYRELLYLRKGFPGILFKNDSFEHTYRALKKIMDGELWFRREILNALLHESFGSCPFLNHIHTTTPKMTPREIETLLFSRFYLNPETVAKRMSVSFSTMRTYLHRLYNKLNLYNFSELNIFTRERALDHYPLLHHKAISGLVERSKERIVLISNNKIIFYKLQNTLKKHFPQTHFFHFLRSDPNRMKKIKKINPEIIIIDRIKNLIPSIDNLKFYLYLAPPNAKNVTLKDAPINTIIAKENWESQFVKFLSSPLYDFWCPRRTYLDFRKKALNQSHFLSLLPWAYEHWRPHFTRMEIKIFFMLTFCLLDKEIADRLNITHSAVRLHVNNLFHKTNCNSRHELLFSEYFFEDPFPFFNQDIFDKDSSALAKRIASLL
jgi:DNA-binding NarL/FixJ family response regulator